MKTGKILLRAAGACAFLVTASCASPVNDGSVVADGMTNHPIAVEPSYQSIKVSFSGAGSSLQPDDSAKLDSFVRTYLAKGNGSISISAPDGPMSRETISYFGERLAALGVPRANILVGTHEAAGGDMRVEIGYVGYITHTDPCANWSDNAADNADNLPRPDFGCSVQQNIAAMVADPRDLMGPRPLSPADATRRATVMGLYEKGAITSADKRKTDLGNEQSGGSSDVH